MKRFLDIRQITICRNRTPREEGGERWSVHWITGARVVIQTFETEAEAYEAVVAHWVTSPTHDGLSPELKAKLPLVVPSARAIEAWMDVADELLKAALAGRAA